MVMEKQRNGQYLAIVALIIGVVGLSIGFSAFSNVLKIQASADVSPDASTFNVDFSSSQTEVLANEITPVVTPASITATAAVIDNTSVPTISNLSASFKEPGQKAVYEFYAFNAGELAAYLKSIVYENVTDSQATKVCTAKEGTTDALVQKACDGISVSVKVGDEAVVTSGKSGITGHELAKGVGEKVVVTIEYQADASRADGDFTVKFGDISLNYSSVD